ncbi:MAG: hypothetical protein COW00_11590 [Bdellovibrio sp. CG12_big_fil_rev_8_21_14_0_65_39_13]|nr:MAG: hypothetical protein COW78_04730 [Bdellovibrio sp. CG22_combo_CG10-13_8_21_14_all_39_27]PIQ59364.1 MAG: hypothetical protein COW00_11590 [Bdellovibrio sp. CG12_big_fil_rev_8_21_14_0_65_39_13]PIR32785.1 MAG: hypothetical protein COV37_18845 [Bdellovibrio sp. CG11_big_fil_rev_8_21_14_0_20_39_38]
MLNATVSFAQDVDSLELLDSSDAQILIDEETKPDDKLDMSKFEEVDDLQSLKDDVGDVLFENGEKKDEVKVEATKDQMDIPMVENPEVVNDEETKLTNQKGETIEAKKPEIFDVGKEEKELIELSRFVEGKIPDKEWDEIATSAKVDKYVVQDGDWLWKISQRLFGSGFYYSKIWSLNPFISNPHEIEPGMVLSFSTGDSSNMPEVRLGDFADEGVNTQVADSGKMKVDYKVFGDEVVPPWLKERKKLIDQGIYFQFASEESYDDLDEIAKMGLVSEFQKYEPPVPDIVIQEPGVQYDSSGFDKSSKIVFNVKEGFFLNTFVTSNIVQDLGEIEGMEKENVFIQQYDKIYVKFDNAVKVKPGDLFSVYVPGGPVKHSISDRSGYKYTIGGQIKTLRKINHLWECSVTELVGTVQRKDRITIYTPKLGKIIKTYNKRNIEAAVIDSFQEATSGLSFGDVVYIDRGRADGVEMGNVFEVYSFYDRGTEKRLTPDPTYKIGELTVITLTDNFATALVTNSSNAIGLGSVALTKTEEQAALAARLKNKSVLKGVQQLEARALDELDVELNLDDIGKDLLEKADKVQLSEDELEELERQEREKSVIKDHERDVKELERLEGEIIEAESAMNESKLDEDKFLEQQSLNEIEKKQKGLDPNGFESLNDLEGEIGLKFLDEDLNTKENPYGLTEFDLEEIDELLNTDQQK